TLPRKLPNNRSNQSPRRKHSIPNPHPSPTALLRSLRNLSNSSASRRSNWPVTSMSANAIWIAAKPNCTPASHSKKVPTATPDFGSRSATTSSANGKNNSIHGTKNSIRASSNSTKSSNRKPKPYKPLKASKLPSSHSKTSSRSAS